MTSAFSRTALMAALAAGLLLAGCGRKGGLEAPPSASLANPPPSGQPTLGEPEHDALEGERRTSADRPAGQKKSFPLDFLITGERDRERDQVREQRAKEEAAAAARR